MSTINIAAQITEISQSLILSETKDPRTLAELLDRFEKISGLSETQCPAVIAGAASAVAGLLKQIILDQSSDPQRDMDIISQSLTVMQRASQGEQDPARLIFPAALGFQPEGAPQPSESGFSLPANVDEEIFSAFLDEQKSTLEAIESQILALEKDSDPEALAALRRILHTLKGETGVLGLMDVSHVCHAVEDFLETVQRPIPTDPLFAVKDWLAAVFDDYSARCPLSVTVDDILTTLSAPSPGPAESPGAGDFQPEEDAGAAETVALDADPSLLADFITESKEHLESVDVHLLTLENEPRSAEALNAVFRAFHTIKGVAGFLNLEYFGNLAHEAETLLGCAQRGERLLAGRSIDVVFEANDMLKELINELSAALGQNRPPVLPPDLPRLVARIQAVVAGTDAPSVPEKYVPPTDKKVGEILVDAGQIDPNELKIALAEQAVDPKHEKLGSYLVRRQAASAKDVAHALRHQRGELVDRRAPAEEPQVNVVDHGTNQPGRQDVGQDRRAVQVKETVRVDTERLDLLVDTIGELVIAEAMITQDPEILHNTSARVAKNLRQLAKVSRELQEMGTAMRMETLRGVFQKMARLVRDLAKKSGKKVNFQISGEDTELDRTVIDKIGDPLIHMVRNAVDHGLEPAEERLAKGKTEEGNVHLVAFHQGGNVHIEIRDDGRGLDHEAIRAKAIERGIITEGDKFSEDEMKQLIFEPGFSTAKKVTDISGRGVGMDVVRRNIEALRGQVGITSEHGKGSQFRIVLPLTLAIIDGMVIKVGGQRFIIPVLSIVESLRPMAETISTVAKKGEMLSLRGELLPLYRLDRLFGLDGAEQDPTRALVIVIQVGCRRAGILVDELVGQQQTVIKSLSRALGKREFVSGAAILSDGRVGLILDADGILRMAVNGNKLTYVGEEL